MGNKCILITPKTLSRLRELGAERTKKTYDCVINEQIDENTFLKQECEKLRTQNDALQSAIINGNGTNGK